MIKDMIKLTNGNIIRCSSTRHSRIRGFIKDILGSCREITKEITSEWCCRVAGGVDLYHNGKYIGYIDSKGLHLMNGYEYKVDKEGFGWTIYEMMDDE